MISVFINGVAQDFKQPVSVADLVHKMGLGVKRVALERNGEIVPRSQFAQQLLDDGDRLEIVIAVGGG